MEMKLKIYYPFKPFNITQHWGNPNPAYRKAGFNFDRHNGVDANTNWKTAHYPVYCPIEGFVVKRVNYDPNGGGHEVWLISKDKVLIGDRECYAYMVFCHAEYIFVKPGDELKLGDLLMIADNTGFSTGEHTHIGLYRVWYDGRNITFLDTNDANGSYNLEEFLTGQYVTDVIPNSTLLPAVFKYIGWRLANPLK